MASSRLVTPDFLNSYFKGTPFGFVTNPGGGINLYVQSTDPEGDRKRFDEALLTESQLYQTALPFGMLHALNTCEFLTLAEIEEDDYIQRVLADKAIIPPRLHLNRWLQPQPPAPSGTARRVTFYSYKGGVGRSTTLALVAICLARAGKRVVVIDFDLEAPGLNSLLLDETNCPPKGVVDYLLEKPELGDELSADVLSRLYLAQPRGFEGASNLFVMPAGHLSGGFSELSSNSSYLEKLSYLDVDLLERSTVADSKGTPLAALFRDIEAAVAPDYILVDSRTGLADIGGSLLFQYSDLVVSLLYNHPQHLVGANMLMSSLSAYKRWGVAVPQVLWVHALLRHHPDSPEGQEFHRTLSLFLDQSYRNHNLHSAEAEDLVLASEERESALEYILRLETLEQLQFRTFQDDRVFTDYLRLARKILQLTLVQQDVVTTPVLSMEDRTLILGELNEGDILSSWSDDLFLADANLREALNYPVIYTDRRLVPVIVGLLELQETVVDASAMSLTETPIDADNDWISIWTDHCLTAIERAVPELDLNRSDREQSECDIRTSLRLLDQMDRQLSGLNRKVTLVFKDPALWLKFPPGALRSLVSLFVSRPQTSLSAKIFVPEASLLVGLGAFGRHVQIGNTTAWSAIVLSALARKSPHLATWLRQEGQVRVDEARHGGLYVHDQAEQALTSVMECLFGRTLAPQLPRVHTVWWMNEHIELPDELKPFTCFRVISQAIKSPINDVHADTTTYLISPASIRKAWRHTCAAWLRGMDEESRWALANQLSLAILAQPLTAEEFRQVWGVDVTAALWAMAQRVMAGPISSDFMFRLVEPIWYAVRGGDVENP